MDRADLEDFTSDLLDNALDNNTTEEEVTVQKVLLTIENAWLNEKFCPEILPHKLEFVECLLEQIKYMEENINKLPKDDIKVDIHKIELQRIKYILTSYLRCRIKKIEKFAFHILEQEAHRRPEELYLSDAELNFAKEFVKNMDDHFDTVLKEMPWNLQTLEPSNKSIKPDLDSYVFFKTNAEISNVIVWDVFENREEEVSLDDKSQHLLPYSAISDLVKSTSVQLI